MILIAHRSLGQLFSMKVLLIQFIYLFVLLLALVSEIQATEYYVDFTGGNDKNDGISSSTPYKHSPGDPNAIGTAASTTLFPGDTVYFKKGVSYLGEVTIGQSGSEQDSGSNGTVTSGGVFTSSGQNFRTTVQANDIVYIYNNSTTGNGELLGSVGFWPVASVDSDTQLTLSGFDRDAHAKAELPYRIWRMITYTSTTSWGSGDAIINGQNTRYRAFDTGTESYIRISRLKIMNTLGTCGYSGGNYGAIQGSFSSTSHSGIIIDNVDFEDAWMAASFLAKYMIFADNTMTDMLGPIGTWFGGESSLMEGNAWSNTGAGTRSGGDYYIIRENEMIDAYSGGNICGFHSDGIMVLGGTDYGWIYNNIIVNSFQGVYITTDGSGTDCKSGSYMTLANNIIIHDDRPVGDYGISLLGSNNARIYNNTIFSIDTQDPEVAMSKGIRLAQDAASCSPRRYSNNGTVKNNLIYLTDCTSCSAIAVSDSGSSLGFVSDHNVVYTPNDADGVVFMDVSGYNLSGWKAIGHGTGSSASEPILVDVAGTVYAELDLHLSFTDTEALDQGTTGLLSFDYDEISRPLGNGWDKGAYESESAGTIDDNPPNPPSGVRIVSLGGT